MQSTRHDRTVRLLAAGLEAVALAGERSNAPACDLEAQMLRLAAGTRNAVRLEIISAQEADQIWASAAARHPGTPWGRSGAPLAA